MNFILRRLARPERIIIVLLHFLCFPKSLFQTITGFFGVGIVFSRPFNLFGHVDSIIQIIDVVSIVIAPVTAETICLDALVAAVARAGRLDDTPP